MLGADQNAQTALLQNVHVVVVRVAHGPAGNVLLGLLVVQRIDVPHMPVAPLVELVELLVRHMWHNGIIDVPPVFPCPPTTTAWSWSHPPAADQDLDTDAPDAYSDFGAGQTG